MSRFRPNVVVAGVRPYEEDSWAALTIGDVTFDNAKPCSRCVVTTIDQTTAKMVSNIVHTEHSLCFHGVV